MNSELFFKHPSLPHLECRRSTNSGRHYKLHIHKTFSIGAIDRGRVEYTVDGVTGTLGDGELVLINPEALHACNPVRSKNRNYYVLYLDPDWCLSLQQSIWNIDGFNPVGEPLLKDRSLFESFIAAMELLLGKGEILEKDQAIIELVGRIFLEACRPAEPRKTPGLNVEDIKERLADRLDRDTTIAEFASDCGANPYTLIRQFKAAAGITPHAYRVNCRIEFAKELLRKGWDLTRTALECGFFDQSHFTRSFKAIMAVTPKEYQVNFLQ